VHAPAICTYRCRYFVARGARFMGRFHVPRAGQTRDEHDGGDETEGGRGGARGRHHRGERALASVVDFFVYVVFLNEFYCVVHCVIVCARMSSLRCCRA
jgi:hypothetical protein